MNEEWVCPKCGAVMSPYTPSCVHCKPMMPMTTVYQPLRYKVETGQVNLLVRFNEKELK